MTTGPVPTTSTPNGAPNRLPEDVAALRQTLAADLAALPARRSRRPFLVVLSGLPGTGKSHFARELLCRVPMVALSSDRLRKALVGQPTYSAEESSRLFAACHRLIEELLAEGRRVLFDATNLTEGHRQPLYEITGRLGVPLVLVRLTAPGNVIYRRLTGRANGRADASFSDADWIIYCRLRPLEEPMGRPYYNVDTSQDITPVVEEIARRVRAGRRRKVKGALETAPQV